MIVVTGGAGFIGGNLVHALNRRGRNDLIVIDDLSDTRKVANLATASLSDYIDRSEFAAMTSGATVAADLRDVTLMVHHGGTSSTRDPDGRETMENNYRYSRRLVDYCSAHSIPMIYASSAAVYGSSESFTEVETNEVPTTVYGLSKLLIDNYARRRLATTSTQLVGLRYFNVYGAGEDHKDSMASLVTQLDNEVRSQGTATIFGASHGVGPGEQRRDFVSVRDVIDVVLWFIDHPDRSGIFNVGTGVDRSVREVAEAVIAHRGGGELRFIDFPPGLAATYQSRTCADLTALRAAGFASPFTSLHDGIGPYLDSRSSTSPPPDHPTLP